VGTGGVIVNEGNITTTKAIMMIRIMYLYVQPRDVATTMMIFIEKEKEVMITRRSRW
jgi:hypothetical protein